MSWKDYFKNGAVPTQEHYDILIDLAEARSALTKADLNEYCGGGGGVLNLQPNQEPCVYPVGNLGKELLACQWQEDARNLLSIVNQTPVIIPVTKQINTTATFTLPIVTNIRNKARNLWLPSERGIEIFNATFTPSGGYPYVVIRAKISVDVSTFPTNGFASFSLFHNNLLIDYATSPSVPTITLNAPFLAVTLEAILPFAGLGAISVRGGGTTNNEIKVNNSYASSSLTIQESV